MAIWSLVPCAEEHGGREHLEDLGLEDSTGSVLLRVSWANRLLLIADIIGRVHPWIPGLRAKTASLQFTEQGASTDGSGQVLIPDEVLIAVSYVSNLTGDLIQERLRPQTEFLTTDWRGLRWGAAAGPPLVEEEAPGKQIKSVQIVRTEHYLSSVHVDHYDLMGSVNDAEYISARLGHTFPIDTLLYHPPELEIVTDATGTERYTLTKLFSYNPEGWNKFWRAATDSWEEIHKADGTGRHFNYPQKDFTNILV